MKKRSADKKTEAAHKQRQEAHTLGRFDDEFHYDANKLSLQAHCANDELSQSKDGEI